MESRRVADWSWIGLVFLVVMFWGEPDIQDAIVHFLMECGG